MIPEGWKEVSLAEVAASPISYGVVQAGEAVEGGVPCVRVVDMASGRLDPRSMITTTEEISRSYSRTILKEGDILIALRGIIGSAAIAPKELNGCNLTRGIARLSPKAAQYSSQLLLQALNAPRFKNYIGRQANGSALQEISIATLRKARIAIPPLAEQKRIAEILSIWDRAIEMTEKLIANSEAQKKALMQQLLTGKKRLPGFCGEWRAVRYGDVLKEIKRPVRWSDEDTYNLISVRRRSGGAFHRESLRGSDILTKSMHISKSGDFVISKMQILHGASAVIPHAFDGFHISGSYISLVPRRPDFDIRFIGWVSKTPRFYHQTYISSYGVHIEKMTFILEDFLDWNFLCPPTKAEQGAIADALDAAEVLQADLKRHRGQLLREKAALMQQLLTGKRRVRVAEVREAAVA